MNDNDLHLRAVWNQNHLPVVLRGGRVRPLIVRLPYELSNYEWMQNDRRTKPEWLSKFKAWSIPKSWLDDTLRRSLARYGAVYLIQPYSDLEKCAPACWQAKGALCECSCMGKNHGSGNPLGKWHVVSETFAVRINDREFSCRLLRPS